MGHFFESIGRAFSFIWAAIRMAFRDKDLILPSLLLIVTSLAYVGVVFVLLNATDTLWLAGIDKEETAVEETAVTETAEPGMLSAETQPRSVTTAEEDQEGRGRQIAQAIFYVTTTFIGFLIFYVFAGMTVSLVYDHICGKDARIGEAFSLAAKRLPQLALLAVVATVINVLARAFRGKRGRENVIGSIVAGIIERLWTVASFLILPGMMIHNLSLWQGLKRAKDIAAKNLLVVAVGEIAVGMVANLIGFLGVAGGVGVGVVVYRVIPKPLFVPVGLGGIIALLAIAFTIYVKAAYYTCLYVNAIETADAGRRAKLRGPLADVLA